MVQTSFATLGPHTSVLAARFYERLFGVAPSVQSMFMEDPVVQESLFVSELETIVTDLVARHGWTEMGRRIPIRCCQMNPSIKSSLTFLRKTPWARQRVEGWFIAEL